MAPLENGEYAQPASGDAGVRPVDVLTRAFLYMAQQNEPIRHSQLPSWP